MKQLIKRLSYAICILLLTCTFFSSYGQKTETELQKEYIQYLKADSNKVVVGFRYITSERCGGDGTMSSMSYCELINPEYKSMFIDEEHTYYAPKMYHGFTEENVWRFRINDLKSGWDYRNVESYRQYIDTLSYIRCEKIRMSLEPTFDGFVRWKEKKYGL